MLVKILGAFLLVIGIVLAVPLAFKVLAGTFAFLWTLAKIAAVGGLIYVGWRWINRQRGVNGWKASGY